MPTHFDYTLNALHEVGRFANEHALTLLLVALAFGLLGYGCRGLARFIRQNYAVPPNPPSSTGGRSVNGLNRD